MYYFFPQILNKLSANSFGETAHLVHAGWQDLIQDIFQYNFSREKSLWASSLSLRKVLVHQRRRPRNAIPIIAWFDEFSITN